MQKFGGPSATYPIGSVGKALALLKLLEGQERFRVMEVSRELDIAPSTAHRLLAMFEQAGFLCQREPNSAYTIGPALVAMATSIAGHLDIGKIVLPHLIELVAEVNETAHVCVLRSDKVVFLESVESSHGLRAVSRVGRVIPAYATASGKVLLAELSGPEVERLFPNEDLDRLTRKTISSRTGLLNELRRIRERGYATNGEESELDFAACAAVVRDRGGSARASIVVAGPASRFKRYKTGTLAAAVRAAAARASATLI
jgi:DNA-binding IclR family transcriptional regulator